MAKLPVLLLSMSTPVPAHHLPQVWRLLDPRCCVLLLSSHLWREWLTWFDNILELDNVTTFFSSGCRRLPISDASVVINSFGHFIIST